MKASVKKVAQLKHITRQLDQAMRNNRREIQSSHLTSELDSVEGGFESNPFATSKDKQERRPGKQAEKGNLLWISRWDS